MKTCRHIDSWDWLYVIVRKIVRYNYRFYFRKITIVNDKVIYENKPVILAPNHQNALMDALAFVNETKFQSVFLARADIFKGKILKKILNFLKIMPVYRLRDGASKMKKNEEIFKTSVQVVQNGKNPLCLFPEGNHGHLRRLRVLQKGIFRIAMSAQEPYKNNSFVKIVPVGLDYSDFYNKGGELLMNYGQPIEVADFYNDYKENPVQTLNKMRKNLATEIKKLMIHIETIPFYDLYMSLRRIFNERMRNILQIKGNNHYDRFRADKKMITALDKALNNKPDFFEELDKRVKYYFEGLHSLHLDDYHFQKKSYSPVVLFSKLLLLLILSPIHLLGMLNNYLPYKIPNLLAGKVKDRQFQSSLKSTLGLITFPVYYSILITLALVFLPTIWLKAAYILTIPYTGQYTFYSYINFRKLFSQTKFWWLTKRKNEKLITLKNTRKEIILDVEKVIKENL
jgi:1-acyl-sn-glycerol-3-phosphate acyltransferase